MCGSPRDLLEAKNGNKEADSSDILFLLIDLYKSVFRNCRLFFTAQFRNNKIIKPSVISLEQHSNMRAG